MVRGQARMEGIAMITLTVYGVPQSRGSKKALPMGGKFGGRPMMVDSNKKSGPWMEEIRLAAGRAYNGPLITGAVRLTCVLYFPRPKGHFGTGKNAGVLKATAPEFHTQKPDMGKCIRAVEDAMKGVVWRDDSQVVSYDGSSKQWTSEQARVEITIEEILLPKGTL